MYYTPVINVSRVAIQRLDAVPKSLRPIHHLDPYARIIETYPNIAACSAAVGLSKQRIMAIAIGNEYSPTDDFEYVDHALMTFECKRSEPRVLKDHYHDPSPRELKWRDRHPQPRILIQESSGRWQLTPKTLP